MSIYYYLPGQQDARHDAILAAGLAHAFDSEPFPFAHVATQRGPDGGAGLLVAPGENDGLALSRASADLCWQQAPGRAWWIGIEGETLPESLARNEQIDGHHVRLGDGQKWLVPVARSMARGSMLPTSLVLGPEGEVVREALPKFAQISAKAGRVERIFFGQIEGDESEDMDLDEGFAIAVEALAVNYRIGPVEASTLRLLTDPVATSILRALVDVPTMLEVAEEIRSAEKNAAPVVTTDGSNSSDGVEA